MSKELTLYFVTNRNHKGRNQFKPDGYGIGFSESKGAKLQNLRFGKLTLTESQASINKFLNKKADKGKGHGEELSRYLTKKADKADITTYEEKSNNHDGITTQGSLNMFKELKREMEGGSDILIYIHGFNNDWNDSVGSALALQEMVNQKTAGKNPNILVVLFSWPSNGRAIPLISYFNDRQDASIIAGANTFARGILKLRDYILLIPGKEQCKRKIHLLCHSMGNYVLQNVLTKITDFEPKNLPLLFDHIFMCAPDVDDDVFQPGGSMSKLPQLARQISIYHNKEDFALWGSDTTKGNPPRLGDEGVSSFDNLHEKIHQIDCLEVAEENIEHSYYLNGLVNKDIRLSLLSCPADKESERNREQIGQKNHWKLVN